MKKKTKAIVLLLAAVVLVVASILGTMAYLTSQAKVQNTFTVGQVKIKLDEADVTGGDDDRTEKGNKYHLLPGHTYVKDPTVTVLRGSDESYVRILMTINNWKELKGNNFKIEDFFPGYDGAIWVYKGQEPNEHDNTRTWEFRYYTTVSAASDDVVLEPLFETIEIADSITNDQLDALAGLKIDIVAQAIQAAGFTGSDAEKDAWDAFDLQNTTP